VFPTDIIRTLQVTIQFLRKLKWVFVIGLYYMAYGASVAIQDFRLVLALLPLLLLSALAYYADQRREEHGFDDFRGDRLFFRYGELIYWAVISIPVSNQWSFEATTVSASTLRAALAQHIVQRLPPEATQVLANKLVTDLSTGQQKEFSRVRLYSTQGSSVTFIIHYAAFGHTITAQYFTYIRGAHRIWDAVKFIVAGPLTIWLWGIPWLLNRRSILADMSHFRRNSFDGIEVTTILEVAHRVIFEETKKLLEAAKLLTPALEQAINYHINNSQTFTVNAQSASFRDINQTTTNAPSKSQPAAAGG
jgi:hypothetical protein